MGPGRNAFREGMTVKQAISYARTAALSRNELYRTAEALDVLADEVERLQKRPRRTAEEKESEK
jgi:hypothetical protein